eukprot:m.128618 g.128618  ORF g.128618 m.128618 type:complete len:176 (-) comp17432_c0_seq1:142-669(-)
MDNPTRGRMTPRWSEVCWNSDERTVNTPSPDPSMGSTSTVFRLASNTVILAGTGTVLVGAGCLSFRAMYRRLRHVALDEFGEAKPIPKQEGMIIASSALGIASLLTTGAMAITGAIVGHKLEVETLKEFSTVMLATVPSVVKPFDDFMKKNIPERLKLSKREENADGETSVAPSD